MPKNHVGASSSQWSGEEECNSGIKAQGSGLSVIPEGSEGASVIATLVNDVDTIQSVVRQHAGQLSDVVGQLRAMAEEFKKIQIDHCNNRVERVQEKEELKSLIIHLSNQVAMGPENPNRSTLSPSSMVGSNYPPSMEPSNRALVATSPSSFSTPLQITGAQISHPIAQPLFTIMPQISGPQSFSSTAPPLLPTPPQISGYQFVPHHCPPTPPSILHIPSYSVAASVAPPLLPNSPQPPGYQLVPTSNLEIPY